MWITHVIQTAETIAGLQTAEFVPKKIKTVDFELYLSNDKVFWVLTTLTLVFHRLAMRPLTSTHSAATSSSMSQTD